MGNTRMSQIIESLIGLGTKANELYTNQEIVDSLVELQEALAKGVFEKTHAENLQAREIMVHFEALAKEHGLDQTDTFVRFKSNMRNLSYTIGSFINGLSGERNARKALKLLSYEKGVRILYNIQLEDEDAQAEYDAIVIAPYGLFVVEVKNWSSPVVITSNGLLVKDDETDIVYDLVGRMSIKQALLREYIGESFPENYQSILVFTNVKTSVEDLYKRVPVVCGGGVACKISEFNTNSDRLTDEDISGIEQAILAHHKVQKGTSPVNCEEIIQDYASLMTSIEVASSGMSNEILDTEPIHELSKSKAVPQKGAKEKWFERIDWYMVSEYALKIAPVVLSAITCGFFKERRS